MWSVQGLCQSSRVKENRMAAQRDTPAGRSLFREEPMGQDTGHGTSWLWGAPGPGQIWIQPQGCPPLAGGLVQVPASGPTSPLLQLQGNPLAVQAEAPNRPWWGFGKCKALVALGTEDSTPQWLTCSVLLPHLLSPRF